MPETWYQVRKKVGDIAYTLPSGVQGPYFNDEFGDVYTNIYALEGRRLHARAAARLCERLRTELLRVPGVNKVDFIADQEQRIYVEIANAQLAKLGLTPQQIARCGRCAERGRRRRASSPPPTIACTCARAGSSRTSRQLA